MVGEIDFITGHKKPGLVFQLPVVQGENTTNSVSEAHPESLGGEPLF
jgi:hypothetical protein